MSRTRVPFGAASFSVAPFSVAPFSVVPFSIVLAVVVPVVFLTALRHQGLSQAHALAETAMANGDWSTLDDYLGAVEIDRDLQEACWAWMTGTELPTIDEPGEAVRTWLALPDGTALPTALSERLQQHRPVLCGVLPFLRRPELVLSAHGWASLDLTSESTLVETEGLRLPSFLRLRATARWLWAEALAADCADPFLNDLDLLVDRQLPSGCIQDWTILFVVSDIRDEAYLSCVLRGNIGAVRRDAWMSERTQHRQWLADGLRAHRILSSSPRTLSGSGPAEIPTFTTAETALSPIKIATMSWTWAALPRDAALVAERTYRVERRLRGDHDVTLERTGYIGKRCWTRFGEMTELSPRSRQHMVESSGRHRALRLAACLILDSRRGEALPLAPEELLRRRPGALDAGPDEARLTYRRLDAESFAVTADLTTAPADLGLDVPAAADAPEEDSLKAVAYLIDPTGVPGVRVDLSKGLAHAPR